MFCLALRTARRPDSGRMCVLLEQMSYENTIYRRYGNMSQANFSRLYLGLSNRPGMGEGECDSMTITITTPTPMLAFVTPSSRRRSGGCSWRKSRLLRVFSS